MKRGNKNNKELEQLNVEMMELKDVIAENVKKLRERKM